MRIWHPLRAGFDRWNQRNPSIRAPAPGDTRAPGTTPVPGTTAPTVPQAATTPPRQSPAPATDCGPIHAGIGFNRNGCMYVWEHGRWQHKQHRLPFNVSEWEARLP